jgi:hypothetical protein
MINLFRTLACLFAFAFQISLFGDVTDVDSFPPAVGDPEILFEVSGEGWKIVEGVGLDGGDALSSATERESSDLAGWLEAPSVIRFHYRAQGNAETLRFFDGRRFVNLEPTSDWQIFTGQVHVPDWVDDQLGDSELIGADPTLCFVRWSARSSNWVTEESDRILIDRIEIFPGYSIDPIVGNGGYVIRQPDQMAYEYGTEVTLTAVAEDGFAFKQWGGFQSGSFEPKHPDPSFVVRAGIDAHPQAWFTAGTEFTRGPLSLSTPDGFERSNPQGNFIYIVLISN